MVLFVLLRLVFPDLCCPRTVPSSKPDTGPKLSSASCVLSHVLTISEWVLAAVTLLSTCHSACHWAPEAEPKAFYSWSCHVYFIILFCARVPVAIVACTLLLCLYILLSTSGHSEKTDVCSLLWPLRDFVPLKFEPGTCCVGMSVVGKALRYLDAYQFVTAGDKLRFSCLFHSRDALIILPPFSL